MNEPKDLLEGLVNDFIGRLTKPVTDGVLSLLDHGEPGLALEELCAYIN